MTDTAEDLPITSRYIGCSSYLLLNRAILRHGASVYDRIDAAATINFSTQFGAATIRERRLFLLAWVQAKKIQ